MQNYSLLEESMELSQWNIIDSNVNGNKQLSFVNQITADKFSEPGIYLFTIDVVAKGLQEQSWWNEWSWKEGRDSYIDGSKTYNLLNFLRGLKTITTNLMEENPPVIGRFCYGIQRN